MKLIDSLSPKPDFLVSVGDMWWDNTEDDVQVFFDVDQGIVEIKELLEGGRIKNTFLNRFSNFLYLRPLLQEHSSPLGTEVKFNGY